jgi:PncC family amidohydrolase
MIALAAQVVQRASAAHWMIATAESLTAGMLVSSIVDIAGASRCVAGGAACYSLDAKHRVLGVDADLLEREGAVNHAVAEAMAAGALDLYGARVAISTTGVAGPGPDRRGIPAGTVFLGLAHRDGTVLSREVRLAGSRDAIRRGSADAALEPLLEHLPPAPM